MADFFFFFTNLFILSYIVLCLYNICWNVQKCSVLNKYFEIVFLLFDLFIWKATQNSKKQIFTI